MKYEGTVETGRDAKQRRSCRTGRGWKECGGEEGAKEEAIDKWKGKEHRGEAFKIRR